MKDDLNKPEDKKQKQPKFEKKSTDQRTQATPPVDNSGEEEIPEWKSSIRREPVQEEKPERKMPVIDKKYMIAAAAVVVLGAVAFGVAPRIMKDPETKKQAAQEETASADEGQESVEQGDGLQADEAALKSDTSNVTETTDVSDTADESKTANASDKTDTPGTGQQDSKGSLTETG